MRHIIGSMVELKKSKNNHEYRDDRFKQDNYELSAPFFENSRGVLIHRIKHFYKLECNYRKHPWYVAEYWCGNCCTTNTSPEKQLGSVIFDPGKKLVCARCELIAVSKGERTSSDLVGRHVCVGSCRAINTCDCGVHQ